MFEPRNPDFPHEAYARFDLDEMAESDSLAEFRFKKRDILSIPEVLDIPETMRFDQRSICRGIEGLCMLLRRLKEFNTTVRLFTKYHISIQSVSNISNKYILNVLKYINVYSTLSDEAYNTKFNSSSTGYREKLFNLEPICP